MPSNEPSIQIRQFLGLRNTDRPARLPLGSLVNAENIDIDDSFGIERRQGYTAVPGLPGVTAAYGTRDESRLYVVNEGILKRIVSLDPLVTVALTTGIPSREVWWAENGEHVFCSGAVNGVIYRDTFTPFADWGSDDAQSFDAQGQTLETDEADIGTSAPPINTECVAFFQGAVWLSYYDTVADQSFLFRSKPFFWSRWDLAADYIAVPGRARLMAGTGPALVIGTDRAISVYSEGVLQDLADYGVIAGQYGEDSGRVYFWTERGLCRALPFEPMTEEAVSLPPGTRACTAVTRSKGNRQAIIVTTGGGEADNQYV
jgi:hypothetical protein